MKNLVRASVGLVIIVVALALLAWFIRGPDPMAFAGGKKIALADYKGANPAGVPNLLAGASLIERGAYLARAADCVACHTAAGGKEYAGGLAFKLPFGVLYSSNITPDPETGIGSYSDRDFLNAVHGGIRRDGSRLYPAMPYPSYSYMTDDDALAIKAFLFSLPPVRQRAPANTLAFPFNQRWTMVFWSRLFNADTRFEPDPSQSPVWNRGAYLSEALAHCGECHTPRNLAFALDNRAKFAGAITAGWHAFNITPDRSSGIGDWSADDLAAYLANGHVAGHGTASGPMGEAVDRSLSRMNADDIKAIVAYLRSVPAMASANLSPVRSQPAPDSHRMGGGQDNLRGKMVFESACVSCHGWTGESPVSSFATLTGVRAVNDPSGTNVAEIVIFGTSRSTPDGALSMPDFGHAYSDEEIAAVANYVTARFGSRGSTLSAADISALRNSVE